MTLQQLRDFVAVVTHGGFRQAASAENVSQGGLSKSVANLEESYGVLLLERRTDGLTLTPQGEEFLHHARAILTEAARADTWLAATRDRRASTVSLGLSIEPSLQLAPTVLGDFRKSHPHVTVQVMQSVSSELLTALRQNRVEVALMLLPVGFEASDLQHEVLYEVEAAVIARNAHPCAQATLPHELAGCDWVGVAGYMEEDLGIHELFEKSAVEPPRIAVISNSVFATVSILLASDCLARLPATMTAHALARSQLVRIPIIEPLRHRQIAAVRKATRKLSHEAATLVAMLSSYSRLLHPRAPGTREVS
jgi:LysR family transcriptional regulator, regulator of abg operon